MKNLPGFDTINMRINNSTRLLKCERKKFNIATIPLFFIFYFFVLLTVSCSKDNSTTVGVTSGKMAVTIDGSSYNLTLAIISKEVHGDTTSIILEGASSDSSKIIGFYIKEIVGLKARMYYCGLVSDGTGGFIQSEYVSSANDTSYVCDGMGSKGSVTIVTYSDKVISGKFQFDAVSLDDSTKVKKISGEFNGAFVANPTAVDLPIPIGSMYATVDNNDVTFNVIAGKVDITNLSKIFITGTASNNRSIVIEFDNFEPKINVDYRCGVIDASANSSVTATFVKDATNSYLSDGKDSTSGVVKLYKFTDNNIQGTFSFTGKNIANHSLKETLANGMFNSRIKPYNK
jgi:hypothetical protein